MASRLKPFIERPYPVTGLLEYRDHPDGLHLGQLLVSRHGVLGKLLSEHERGQPAPRFPTSVQMVEYGGRVYFYGHFNGSEQERLNRHFGVDNNSHTEARNRIQQRR